MYLPRAEHDVLDGLFFEPHRKEGKIWNLGYKEYLLL